MLLALLLLAAQTPPALDLGLSPAVEALVAARATLPVAEFPRRMTALAESGDTGAAEFLGEALMRGEFGFAADPAKACDWHERASGVRGDAAHNIALCFEKGRGRAENKVRARELYARAATLGWTQSKCALGTMLISGSGGARDVARGLALCREASEAGDANAQTDYGGYLLVGEVVPRDFTAALRWLTAAATQNQANAAFLLGQMHWKGDGTPANHAEAARWWRVAFANGRADAAGMMARETFERLIIVRDGKKHVDRSVLPEAKGWLTIASEQEPDPERRAAFAESLKLLEE